MSIRKLREENPDVFEIFKMLVLRETNSVELKVPKETYESGDCHKVFVTFVGMPWDAKRLYSIQHRSSVITIGTLGVQNLEGFQIVLVYFNSASISLARRMSTTALDIIPELLLAGAAPKQKTRSMKNRPK